VSVVVEMSVSLGLAGSSQKSPATKLNFVDLHVSQPLQWDLCHLQLGANVSMLVVCFSISGSFFNLSKDETIFE
jgi:hypothetical protein